MKVLQLGKFYPVQGGVEKVMYDLTVGLSEHGVACDMMCALLRQPSRTVRINSRARLIGCKAWAKVAATMISPAMLYRLRKCADGYDLIHIHHPDPMACLALMCSGYRGKVVLHWHSDILKQRGWLRLYRPMQEWLKRRADVIVGTTPVYVHDSPCLADVQDKIVCLPIGIKPLPVMESAAAAIRRRYEGKKIIFALGRLIPYKGFRYLIEAAGYLDDGYVILIGGTGPLREALARQIRQADMTGRVELLGFVPDAELPAYYQACDVFCLSSVQKTEAFGIVQIEAMSCGKPVVATNIPQSGVPWVNKDGVSGLNVAPCNARALAGAIRRITEDRQAYAAYSEGALKRYEGCFTLEKMITDCLKIYQSIK